MAVGDIDLCDKVIVVTGGGSGIHLEFSKLAAAQGAKVLIADIKVDETVLKPDANIAFYHCDVSVWSDLRRLVDFAVAKYRDIPDIWVAGAGVFEPDWSNFWDDAEDERYKAVQINVDHPIKLTRLAIRALVSKKKKGVVLIMASIAGYAAQFPAPLYSATKHALVGFTRAMQPLEEIAGIKVVTICPGIVKTPLWTANASAIERYGFDENLALSAVDVAQAEIKLVKDGQYTGGTVYEISLFGERVVPEWNIQPPGHDSPELLKGAEVPQEAIERALKPILTILGNETGQG